MTNESIFSITEPSQPASSNDTSQNTLDPNIIMDSTESLIDELDALRAMLNNEGAEHQQNIPLPETAKTRQPTTSQPKQQPKQAAPESPEPAPKEQMSAKPVGSPVLPSPHQEIEQVVDQLVAKQLPQIEEILRRKLRVEVAKGLHRNRGKS